MVDGASRIENARDIGRIVPSTRTLLVNSDILRRREGSDWFRFRAGGRGIRRFGATFTPTSQIVVNGGGADNPNDTTGFTTLTRISVFFQENGSDEIRRLGSLQGANQPQAFIFPKGAGTYYVRVRRADRTAYRGNIAHSLRVEFVLTNLTPEDDVPDNPLFF